MRYPPNAEPRRPTLTLTDAALIAAVPAVGYVIGFAYEAGFASHFEIPHVFISVSPAVFLPVGFGVIASALFLLLAVVNTLDMIPRWRGRRIVSAFPAGLYLLITLTEWFVPGADRNYSSFVIPLLLVVLVLELISLLISLKRGDVSEGSEATGGEDNPTLMRRVVGMAVTPIGRHIFIALCLLGYASRIGYGLGLQNARQATEYLVIGDARPEVVLRVYNSTLVVAPLDAEATTVRPQFRLLEVPSSRHRLELTRIGPLKPSDVPGARRPHKN